MITFLIYLLKVSVCLVVFYSFYSIALSRNTFFKVNRIYLLTTLLLSFLIPVLDISIFNGSSVFVNIIEISLNEPELSFLQTNNTSQNVTDINYFMILPVIYFAGISFLFFKFLFSIIKTLRIKGHSTIIRNGKVLIIRTKMDLPFSFFNMVFLPEYESNRMIIEHEIAHIKQLHWIDLILAETALIFLWFNPFVFLYKNAIKLQHEFLADSYVVRNNNPVEDYLRCMLLSIESVSLSGLTSSFYCKTFKKRIIMITKNKTSLKVLGVYLLVLPMVCLLLFAFTGSNYKTSLTAGTVTLQNSQIIPSLCPVDIKKVTKTNGFGERINPITGQKDFHYAVDFAVPEGEKVISTAQGVVVEASFDNAKGNYLLIQHSDIYSTFYSHLKSLSVKVGEKLDKGQMIGIAGNTGSSSTGSHLHYEVFKNGERVNPSDYLPK